MDGQSLKNTWELDVFGQIESQLIKGKLKGTRDEILATLAAQTKTTSIYGDWKKADAELEAVYAETLADIDVRVARDPLRLADLKPKFIEAQSA